MQRQHGHRTYTGATRRRGRANLVRVTPLLAHSTVIVAPASLMDRQVQYVIRRRKTTAEIFRELAKRWHEETCFVSSVKKRISHPDYQSIIGIGPGAVPLILKELLKRPEHWFWALQAITRDDPTTPDADFNKMREEWLNWGKDRGYLL